MLPMILAGMGAGLLKSELVDKPQANRERQLAATTAALSPWTGLTPTMPQEANPFGSMLQGGLAGAQLGQGLQNMKAAAPGAGQISPLQTSEGAAQAMQEAPKSTINTIVPKMSPGMRKNPYDALAQQYMIS